MRVQQTKLTVFCLNIKIQREKNIIYTQSKQISSQYIHFSPLINLKNR